MSGRISRRAWFPASSMRFLSAALLLCVAGCAETPGCDRGAHSTSQIDLYFGMNIANGDVVSEPDWQRFSEGALSVAFPAGFTVVIAAGQWRNPKTGEIVREPARVVSALGARFEDARQAAQDYRVRFRQDSVAIVQRRVCAAF